MPLHARNVGYPVSHEDLLKTCCGNWLCCCAHMERDTQAREKLREKSAQLICFGESEGVHLTRALLGLEGLESRSF
jgi:hypothetical protein